MATQAKFKGTFELIDTVTKKSEITKPIDVVVPTEEFDYGKLNMDPSTTDLPLPMGGVTNGKFLYLNPSRSVDVKLNGAATAITVTKATVIVAEFTGALLTTDSNGEAVVEYFVGGD